MFCIAVLAQKVFAQEACILLLVVGILHQDALQTWKTCYEFLATLLLLLASVYRDLLRLRSKKLLKVAWFLDIACQTPSVIAVHQTWVTCREKMVLVVGPLVVRLVVQPYSIAPVASAPEVVVLAAGLEVHSSVAVPYHEEVLRLLEIFQIHPEMVLAVPYPQEDAIHLELWQLSSF